MVWPEQWRQSRNTHTHTHTLRAWDCSRLVAQGVHEGLGGLLTDNSAAGVCADAETG